MSSYHGWTHRTKEDGGTDPIPGAGTNMDFAWIARSTSQTITESTAYSGAGYSPQKVVMDEYFVSPGGADTEHSAGGAFRIDTVNKRVELIAPGIYFFDVEPEWESAVFGLLIPSLWYLSTSGSGYIWNDLSSFPHRGSEMDPWLGGATRTVGPLLTHATSSSPVRTDFYVAQHFGLGDVDLTGMNVTMVFIAAKNLNAGITIADLVQSF